MKPRPIPLPFICADNAAPVKKQWRQHNWVKNFWVLGAVLLTQRPLWCDCHRKPLQGRTGGAGCSSRRTGVLALAAAASVLGRKSWNTCSSTLSHSSWQNSKHSMLEGTPQSSHFTLPLFLFYVSQSVKAMIHFQSQSWIQQSVQVMIHFQSQSWTRQSVKAMTHFQSQSWTQQSVKVMIHFQ